MNKIYQFIKKKGIYILVIGYLIFGNISNQYDIYMVKNCEYEIINSKVFKVIRVVKSPGFGIYYTYKYNGKKYNGYDIEPSVFIDDFKYNLINKNIQLIICKSDMQFQELLINPQNYEERKLAFPNSLNWVRSYLK